MPTEPITRTVPLHELLSLYIEHEASRYQTDPETDPERMIRDTLCDVARSIGLSPLDEMLHEATQTILHPSLQVDALSTLQALHQTGVSLLCLCPTDIPVLLDHLQASLPSDLIQVCGGGRSVQWYNRSVSLYSAILDKCRTLHADITPESVVIVTTSPHRIIEPAHAQGFPTVLICRARDIESQVVIRDSPPTYVLHELQELVDNLSKLSIVHAPLSQDQRRLPPAFRIKSYQTRGSIGHKGMFALQHLYIPQPDVSQETFSMHITYLLVAALLSRSKCTSEFPAKPASVCCHTKPPSIVCWKGTQAYPVFIGMDWRRIATLS